jgi:hypothetical protein
MKKYVMGLAVLTAIVVFSAFTSARQQESKKELKYYFFEVVSGQIDPGQPLNAEPLTIGEFEMNNPVECPEGDDVDCVRAWEETNTPTATGADDYTIRKGL